MFSSYSYSYSYSPTGGPVGSLTHINDRRFRHIKLVVGGKSSTWIGDRHDQYPCPAYVHRPLSTVKQQGKAGNLSAGPETCARLRGDVQWLCSTQGRSSSRSRSTLATCSTRPRTHARVQAISRCPRENSLSRPDVVQANSKQWQLKTESLGTRRDPGGAK